MAPLCDLWLAVDSADTPRIQEGHILAGHLVCEMVERTLFGGEAGGAGGTPEG